MSKEFFCAVGGDTNVRYGDWVLDGTDSLWIVLGNEDGTLSKGICERPLSCLLRSRCTGKVMVGDAADSGLGRPVIHDIYFNSPQVIHQLEFEQDEY